MKLNGTLRPDLDGVCVADVLVAAGIESRGIAVAVNGEVVRRSEWPTVLVGASDVVEVVTAVAGG